MEQTPHQSDMDSIVCTALKEIECMKARAKALPLVLYAESRLREIEKAAKQWGTTVPDNVVQYVRRISMAYQLRISMELAEETKQKPEECQIWIDKARTYAKELGTPLRDINPLLDIAYQRN